MRHVPPAPVYRRPPWVVDVCCASCQRMTETDVSVIEQGCAVSCSGCSERAREALRADARAQNAAYDEWAAGKTEEEIDAHWRAIPWCWIPSTEEET